MFLLLDEEYTAHVASAEEVEDSLIGKMQGKWAWVFLRLFHLVF